MGFIIFFNKPCNSSARVWQPLVHLRLQGRPDDATRVGCTCCCRKRGSDVNSLQADWTTCRSRSVTFTAIAILPGVSGVNCGRSLSDGIVKDNDGTSRIPTVCTTAESARAAVCGRGNVPIEVDLFWIS